jgi:hypothetical protein
MKRRLLIFATAAVVALTLVSAAWALRFTDESYSPPTGHVGSPYTFAFGGAGGCGPALPYQYNLIGGSLPPGLALAKSGQVSGTPAQAGKFSFWVNLSDQDPPSADWCRPSQAQREFTITVDGAGGGSPPPPPPNPGLAITTAALPPASAGNGYSLTLAASGAGAKTWSIAAGALPPGLSLTSDGVVTGTPLAPGTTSFTVKVAAGGATAQKAFTLEVGSALQIDAPTSKVAEVAVPLTVELHAGGGSGPYRWEITQGSFPTHVGFIGDQGDGSTALIKGVPADAGRFPLTFAVTDVRGRTTTHAIVLDVSEKLRLTTVRMPPAGHVGRPYRAIGFAQGGVGNLRWSVARGALPVGLRLDPSTGVISGRPARRGRTVLYLAVADDLGASRSTLISILIQA